ncbi:glycosyl hydrolase [Botrimarina mediterranea]|uniref:F5/8 type C domain protein n=1 Tax=Botrimarina mediterranea TaxID=2528022 RepID=A0A518K409_9BACT|nr:glycosyl hydrolase [Botrimarina mediterranea]QDV72505.1 F5/8 type C domain protein [Botrimarina mediterranea]QDV77077.1 F5/8 type C domain protein [Planctomycetes bacterium K2D]
MDRLFFLARFGTVLLAGLLTAKNGGAETALVEALPGAPIRPELAPSLTPVVALEAGWGNPPTMARTRCWWWWLNGNVTRASITRDLEEMKRQGLGGANIIDAGGAEQRGNHQVPHGPDFGSPEWRELFVHALREADRLGLELGFNIQSGWNLGGPRVPAEDAAKKLTWSEVTVRGGAKQSISLAQPAAVGGYYRDVAVLALPIATERADQLAIAVKVDSAQPGHAASMILDGNPETFWVSGSYERGEGPHVSQPHRVEFDFAAPTEVSRVVIHPRDGYGPKRGWLQASDRPRHWRLVSQWRAESGDKPVVIDFEPTAARRLRLIIAEAFDPRSPAAPRNVQVAEVEFFNGDKALHRANSGLARIENFRQKAYHDYPGAFTATKADHLLRVGEGDPAERTVALDEAINLTDRLDSVGELDWEAPPGLWAVVRMGYTLAGSRVSTHSEGWDGWAIDYLDRDAFVAYWDDVIEPLLEAAGPSVGNSLRYLHTDSWELGPVNWTPRLEAEFTKRRGYDPRPYLPALAGYVVGDRETSNRFLNDFRRTLADLIAAGKYATFREFAHAKGLGVHPESGGPHAAPIDALQCLGRNDIAMGEFWARSRTHRVNDYERLFVMQSASAAHTYGRRVVLAEAFTSIGPQWEESPAVLKPVFDRVACEGLNLVMLHTFAASPEEAGLPGQAYFAGTHVNPNVTWWDKADAFFGYLNRCQFLLQQGLPVADVLHFYGENVPGFVRLKNDFPAGDVTGFGYDVINAEALVGRVSVADGRLVLPEGTSYRVLSLPPGGTYGLAALRKIAELADAGATIAGPRPEAAIGLLSEVDQREFDRLVAKLWDDTGAVSDTTPREVLAETPADFDFTLADGAAKADERGDPVLDYFHRRTDGAEVYFLANRTAESVTAECEFRVADAAPAIWDPVTGDRAAAKSYAIGEQTTRVPLTLAPEQALFVVFQGDRAETLSRNDGPNLPVAELAEELTMPWSIQFDAKRGGPAEPVAMETLSDWSQSDDTAVRHYSGTATYTAEWTPSTKTLKESESGRVWIDLGDVKNVASVRLNGEEQGVAWTPPYRVELHGPLQADNHLEIEVVNLWPNRLIGDAALPESERITRTNITKFQADTPLLPSGLLGPVQVLTEAPVAR